MNLSRSPLDDPKVQAEIAEARVDQFTWGDIAEMLRFAYQHETTPEGLRAALRRRGLVSGAPAYGQSVVRPKPPAHHVARKRTCLHCRKPFQSSWNGERICKNCRDAEKFQGYGAVNI